MTFQLCSSYYKNSMSNLLIPIGYTNQIAWQTQTHRGIRNGISKEQSSISSSPVGNISQRMRQTRISGYTRGRIKCRGVSIECRPVTSAMGTTNDTRVIRIQNQYHETQLSNDLCDTHQAACNPKGGCTGKLYRYNDRKISKMLTVSSLYKSLYQ
jgi:hypothetical protein